VDGSADEEAAALDAGDALGEAGADDALADGVVETVGDGTTDADEAAEADGATDALTEGASVGGGVVVARPPFPATSP